MALPALLGVALVLLGWRRVNEPGALAARGLRAGVSRPLLLLTAVNGISAGGGGRVRHLPAGVLRQPRGGAGGGGAADGAGAGGGAALAAPGGALSDRYGRRTLLLGAFAALGICMIGFAQAEGLLLAVLAVLIGASGSLASPIVLVYAAELARGGRTGQAVGIAWGVGIAISSVAAPATGAAIDAFGFARRRPRSDCWPCSRRWARSGCPASGRRPDPGRRAAGGAGPGATRGARFALAEIARYVDRPDREESGNGSRRATMREPTNTPWRGTSRRAALRGAGLGLAGAAARRVQRSGRPRAAGGEQSAGGAQLHELAPIAMDQFEPAWTGVRARRTTSRSRWTRRATATRQKLTTMFAADAGLDLFDADTAHCPGCTTAGSCWR